jgi:hypothetical protein
VQRLVYQAVVVVPMVVPTLRLEGHQEWAHVTTILSDRRE